jgi:Tol biopolymer transport system component
VSRIDVIRIMHFALLAGVALLCSAPAASAQRYDTMLISRDDGMHGNVGDGYSRRSSLSADGSVVAFESDAANLLGNGDTSTDVFVREPGTGRTFLISRTSAGQKANGTSFNPAISDDGRYVAFESTATNLSAQDTDAGSDIYVHDRATGATTLASVSSSGTHYVAQSTAPDISGNGRFVVFASSANLIEAFPAIGQQVYRHDLQTGETVLISRASGGAAGNGASYAPSISDDGSHIAFESVADNLRIEDPDTTADVFVRDQSALTTTLASRAGGEHGAKSLAPVADSAISGDGQSVLFVTSTALDAGDQGNLDFYVRRLSNFSTTWVSQPINVQPVLGAYFTSGGAISRNGRYVAFSTDEPQAIGNGGGEYSVMFRDLLSGTTTLASQASGTGHGSGGENQDPAVSADGRFVSFYTREFWFTDEDANGYFADVYLRDELGPPPPDSDGDGIVDTTDRCPQEDSRSRDADHDGCLDPYPDTDGDGITDNVDSCPVESSRGRDVDENGCLDTIPDSDGDGIPDSSDRCPQENSSARDAKRNGCLDYDVLHPNPRFDPANYFGRKPVVRKGHYIVRGIRIRSFTVRDVPRGTKLTVSCTRHACPTTVKITTGSSSHTTVFKALKDRRLPKGAKLTIVATRRGYLGGGITYTTNPFRRGDAFCLKPGSDTRRATCAAVDR